MNHKIYKRLPLIFIFSLLFFSLKSQDCNITSKANDIIPDKLCAPVSLTWEVTYRGVNDGGTPVQIVFDWNDGNPVEVVSAINTNPSPTVREWSVTVSHVYPQGGPRCNYEPTATLQVNGVLCTSSVQQQNVTVWDVDDQNGGQISITPEIFPICLGNDGLVVFNDVSLLNCVPPVENDNPNTPTRWTQWVYGTSYTINNVEVDGVVQSYPYYDAVYAHPGPVYGPTPPNISSLPVYAPNTALLGQMFEVTLRYWNVCNPYDDPLIPGPPADTFNGDYPPVTTTAIILIVPYPDATITPVGPFCANDPAVNLHAATSGGTWSGLGITNPSTGRFNPSVAGPGTHTVTYSVTDGNGCTGTDTEQIIVYALPQPNILPGTNLQVCPGNNLSLNGNPTPGSGTITSHQWTGDTGPLNATNVVDPIFNTTSQGVYHLTYTVTDNNGCQNSQTITISVNPVSAHILPNPAEACRGIDFQLYGNPSGGTGTYTIHSWTGDTGPLNVTNVQNPVFNTNVLGTYNLTYTVVDNNGCTGTDNTTVTVFDVPVANAGADDTICSNTIQLNAIPSIGLGSWTMVSGPGFATFADAGLYNSTVTVNSYGLYSFSWIESFGPSCEDADTISVLFIQQPNADAGENDSLCGMSTILSAVPSVGIGQWSLQSGPGNVTITSTGSPVTNVSVDAFGQYAFVWTETNGGVCCDRDTVLISFDVVPQPGFTPVNANGCPPFDVSFTNTTVGGASSFWDFGDGNTSTLVSPSHTFQNTTTADITYTVKLRAVSSYGCVDSISHQVVVHPNPHAAFTHDGVPACSPNTVNFFNSSTGATSYIWHYGDSSTPDSTFNASHTFFNNSTLIQYYQVDLVAISNYDCKDTTTNYITVFPDPDYPVLVTPDSICSPFEVDITTTPGASTYNWSFGDGTSEIGTSAVSHLYTNFSSGQLTYTIQLIGTSFFGCVDTSYATVTVNPKPTVTFTVNTPSGCTPFNATFTNTSSGASSFSWDFGDGNASTSLNTIVNHTFQNSVSNPVTYYVKLQGENAFGCIDSAVHTVNVYPAVIADFICDTVSCSPLDVSPMNHSYGAIDYLWNFGDGTLSNQFEPSHSYTNMTTATLNYPLTLTATSAYGCTDTKVRYVHIYPVPHALFTALPTSQTLPNSTVIIDNQTTGGGWNYNWNFGDGQTSVLAEPASHQYSTFGTYDIVLIVSGTYGCSDTASTTITINAPTPVSSFEYEGDGCAPLRVDFVNTSLYATSYTWDFGDGDYSTDANPSHTYYDAGTYVVILTASGPGGFDLSGNGEVHVYQNPTAYFTVAPTVVFLPDQPVNCFNLSEHAIFYLWNFGDGATSTEINPVHYYQEEGEFDIMLIATTEHQCIDSFMIQRAVVAESSGRIDFPSAFTPNPLGPNDGVYDPLDYNNDIFHPVFVGVAEYELTIYNRWGELIFETKDPGVGWNGYYRGELCKQDVYVWKAKGKFLNGQSFFDAGDVTLLR